MKILILNNGFFGSYSSNQVYYREIYQEFLKLGHCVFVVNDKQGAIDIYEHQSIDFSFAFGKYNYFWDSVPLYEFYRIPHYQWISDNPFKMNIDVKGTYVKYIYIDSGFGKIYPLQHEPLLLPLGCVRRKQEKHSLRVNGILFPGQIRDIREIETQIRESRYRKEIEDFLEGYDFDSAFIDAFLEKFDDENVEKKISLFRLCNSFTRAKKRIKVINAIHELPVYIAGEKLLELENRNLIYIGEKKFSEIENEMKKYKFVLNVDPNYYDSVHDRVTRAINAGSIVITNSSVRLCEKNGFPGCFFFRSLEEVDRLFLLSESDYSHIKEKQAAFVDDCYWDSSIQKIIRDFEHWRS
ncbi:MAG: hypothetical protein HDR06_11335 [Lachnospiraceae bacterium]|nr:hypothetical protein [Lachnospiraceae bacterium]